MHDGQRQYDQWGMKLCMKDQGESVVDYILEGKGDVWKIFADGDIFEEYFKDHPHVQKSDLVTGFPLLGYLANSRDLQLIKNYWNDDKYASGWSFFYVVEGGESVGASSSYKEFFSLLVKYKRSSV